jgi:general nucleoside transport system ATP-binding protein
VDDSRPVPQENLLEVRGLTKIFGSLRACDAVDLTIAKGEIHALLGENGAGKSTLVKMLFGSLEPASGEIFWKGEKVAITSPGQARSLGIGMVFQHFSLFEALSAAENIALSLDRETPIAEIAEKSRDLSQAYGLPLDPYALVGDLSVGERQRIEIIRCLLQEPELIILDEPTSVLTPQEVEQLFTVLRKLASEGCSILYISHKLHEIRALCDTATILRGGKLVDTCDPKEETSRSMAEKMIGAGLKDIVKPAGRSFGETKLFVNRLSTLRTGHFDVPVNDVSFTVRAGEILGIAGVAGNGQNALLDALSGEIRSEDRDAIAIDGKGIGHMDTTERRRHGLCAVPEERNGHAAVGDFTLSDNSVLTARDRLGMVVMGLINSGAAKTYTGKVIADFAVKALGPASTAGSLSGGNLQKYIMGREILQKPSVLVVSQPTWGVDAGAAAAIHQALVDLASAGSAIVVISQDLDELRALSDTLAVINMGRLSEARPVKDFSVEEIGLLMGGVHGAEAA